MVSLFKGIILAILLFISAIAVQAQRITFCEKVDTKGNPINTSKTFSIGKKGGYLYFLVKLPAEIGHEQVIYDLFWVDKDGNEHYDNTVRQKVESDWLSFWKEVEFYHAGNYRVYVYNAFDKFLCMGELSVVMK